MSETEIHDGAEEPLPDPELPAPDEPVNLTVSAVFRSSEGDLPCELPASMLVTHQGDVGDGMCEVSKVLVMRAIVPYAAIQRVVKTEPEGDA